MTYVLVPGAGGQGTWLFQRLVPLLDADAICVDLPAGDDSAGFAEYADAIVAAAARAAGPITLVAQSLGGFSAPLAVDRLDVARLVTVNAMLPMPGETFGEWWGNTGQGEAMAAGGYGEYDDQTYFFHDVPGDIVAAALEGPEFEQADRPLNTPWPLASWPDVPTQVVAGADDRFFPPEFQARVARERLGRDVDVLPGGHLMPLSRPAELAAYLRG